MTRRWIPLAAVLLCTWLAGCSNQELYSKLTERQANEMVAVLRSAGIDADKHSQDGQFSVLTARGDFPQAVRVLNAQGYPRDTFDTMGKVFKREGFVSSPLEERARLIHAMSQEISNTLASIDGVVTARVHLVVPERHPLLSDKPQPSAASVFIKHRPDRDLAAQVTQIKALVVNSIEGLSYDNVTVALFPAEAMPADPSKADRAGLGGLQGPLLFGTLAGAFVLLGSGALWWHRRQRHPLPADVLPALAAPDARKATLPRTDFQTALRRKEQ
ncbi:type III secretion system inner membrane ring lipoprotein SctJ [Aquabacterium sp.]|uniref:type III secretion system inner membrane ring lipoprotein SctJ n=1 Tax=Aquabacterium sp. TaxID=1872578 RepID=UPI002B576831|nr:type III secretion inner membrane ring lipoprotein SctJ [Aquabacterium sp.]HSW05253.1 type III secretion inner membrane ring lipoprotein SctJ [Aquabacterium sp.]